MTTNMEQLKKEFCKHRTIRGGTHIDTVCMDCGTILESKSPQSRKERKER